MIPPKEIRTLPVLAPSNVRNYYGECLKCLDKELWVAAVLTGSTCLEVALQHALTVGDNSPWKPLGKTAKQIRRMHLIDLIDWARQVGCLSRISWVKARDVAKYRNYLAHPAVGTEEKIVKRYAPMKRTLREVRTRTGWKHELDYAFAFFKHADRLALGTAAGVHHILKEIYT